VIESLSANKYSWTTRTRLQSTFSQTILWSLASSKRLGLSCRLLFIPVLTCYFNLPKPCLEPVVSTVMNAGRDQRRFLSLSSLMLLLLPASWQVWLYALLRLWDHQILPTPVHWQQNRCHLGVSAVLTFC